MNPLTDESQKQQRIEMIRQALRDKVPGMYEDLESSGRLEIFLEGHDAEMMASYETAKNEAWQETLKNFLTFTESCCDEANAPMG